MLDLAFDLVDPPHIKVGVSAESLRGLGRNLSDFS